MRPERNTINNNIQAAGSDLDAQIKAELVRRRAQQLQQETLSLWRNVQDLFAASLEKLQTVGTVFVGRITPFKPRPSKRSEDFTDTLKEYASNLTQSIAERGEILAEYRDDLSHELRKRGRRVRRTLQKQNRRLQKQLQRQFQQRQKRTFWIAAGFAFGLTLAGIIGYQFLSHRLQQRREEEATLELPMDSQNGNVMIAATPEAAFVGVTSTKLYYPIEIPLDQLPTENDSPVDAIYFQSEQEATKQGFQPATSY